MRSLPILACLRTNPFNRALMDVFDVDAMPDPAALLTLDGDVEEYGMLVPEQTVVVRAYADDGDDVVLSELQPRYVIMYEPNLDFVRRLEVRFSSFASICAARLTIMWRMSRCTKRVRQAWGSGYT